MTLYLQLVVDVVYPLLVASGDEGAMPLCTLSKRPFRPVSVDFQLLKCMFLFTSV